MKLSSRRAVRAALATAGSWLAVTLAPAGAHAQVAAPGPDAASIQVDLGRKVGEMYPMWAYWGYDEPNYTYSWEGKKLLTELAELSPVPVHVRAHSLLNTTEGPPSAFSGARPTSTRRTPRASRSTTGC